MIPLPSETRHVTWPDGSIYEVSQGRCLACGAAELVSRDWDKKHENDEPVPGQYMEKDGRTMHVTALIRREV